MGFAEGVTAGDERNRLFVVHRHAGEDLTDIPGRRDRIRVALRVLEVSITAVALVAEPGVFAAPEDVLSRLPNVLASAAEAESLESHRFKRAVAG